MAVGNNAPISGCGCILIKLHLLKQVARGLLSSCEPVGAVLLLRASASSLCRAGGTSRCPVSHETRDSCTDSNSSDAQHSIFSDQVRSDSSSVMKARLESVKSYKRSQDSHRTWLQLYLPCLAEQPLSYYTRRKRLTLTLGKKLYRRELKNMHALECYCPITSSYEKDPLPSSLGRVFYEGKKASESPG